MKSFLKEKFKGNSPGVIAGKVVFGIIAVTALAFVFGYALMWLWNSLMPEIFGVKAINYWQAVGLFILSKILFTPGGGSRHHKSKHGKRLKKGKFESFYEKKCLSKVNDWKHYESFWQEEGEQAYENYKERLKTKEN